MGSQPSCDITLGDVHIFNIHLFLVNAFLFFSLSRFFLSRLSIIIIIIIVTFFFFLLSIRYLFDLGKHNCSHGAGTTATRVYWFAWYSSRYCCHAFDEDRSWLFPRFWSTQTFTTGIWITSLSYLQSQLMTQQENHDNKYLQSVTIAYRGYMAAARSRGWRCHREDQVYTAWIKDQMPPRASVQILDTEHSYVPCLFWE